jgi:hypothetical protein
MSDLSLIYPVDLNQNALPTIGYSNIADGFSSIARLMGLNPKDCVFMNSLVVDRHNQTDRKAAATDDLDIRANQYVLALSGAGSYAAHFDLTSAHADYVGKYLEDGHFISVPKASDERLFPGGSLIYGIEESLKQRQNLQSFMGKNILNSYCLSDAERLADKLGGKTLNSPEDYLTFLNKTFVHRHASEFDIPVAPGLAIEKPGAIDLSYALMETEIKELGLSPEQTKIWVKAGALSGGQGIVPVKGLTPENWKAAFTKIAQAYYDAGFYQKGSERPTTSSFNSCDYFMPLVVEVDAGHMPNSKRVALNACVQGVVGDKGVSLVGTTLQHTVDGEYIGSVMPSEGQHPEIFTAQKCAQKLMNALYTHGYKGFVGVDVLVVENKDGKLQGYVLEVNPRLNSSTPLLRMVQYCAREAGQHRTGNSANYLLPHGVDPISYLEKAIGKEAFYRRAESGYCGFVPVMIDQPPEADRPVLVKGLVISHSLQQANEVQQNIRKALEHKTLG